MSFYAEPAFFMALAPLIAVAAVFGTREKPLRCYGAIVSLVMTLTLFVGNPHALMICSIYIAMSLVLAKTTMQLFREEHPRAMHLYWLAIILELAPLAIYKVTVTSGPGLLGFIGISYITFKSLEVIIETRDGLIKQMGILDYLYFLSFFPTFTSGPIMRSRQFVSCIHETPTRERYLERLYRGLASLLRGALYKFCGASVAQWALWFVPQAIDSTGSSFPAIAVSCVLYGIFEFFDFCGYSDMAMGVGLCLGVDVPRNFDKPFLAPDLKQFWLRWHASLSTWMRDFVFMRFVRMSMEHKWFRSRLTNACIGYTVTMLVVALWHGFNVSYLAYGVFWGACMCICEIYQKKWAFYKRHRRDKWFQVAQWALTMVCVFIGFGIFSGRLP